MGRDAATILLADDDLGLLTALSVRLEANGYQVVTAQDAVQAVSLARRTNPDLLLLDINMPAGDGFTIQDRIHAIESLRNTPVIYVTGERSTRASYGAREKGAHALIYKPIDTERLLIAVAEAIGATDSIKNTALNDLQSAADNWTASR